MSVLSVSVLSESSYLGNAGVAMPLLHERLVGSVLGTLLLAEHFIIRVRTEDDKKI